MTTDNQRQRPCRLRLGWLAAAGLILGCGARAADLILADAGRTEYRIVVPAQTDPGTRAVAADFAAILREMTGAEFVVDTDAAPPGAAEIVVGADNARLADLGLAALTAGFVEGEYEIRRVGRHLVIAGAPRRGTINGLYGFLQDHLGCRWFTPACQYVPERDTVTLGEVQDRQRPAFRWRSADSNMQWDANWVIRNRLNESKAGVAGGAPAVQQVHGDPRSIGMTNCWRPHALQDIPPSLFEEHPEFYSEFDGKRVCDPVAHRRAYCVSNPRFAEWVAEWTNAKMRANPQVDFVSITHADSPNFCRCRTCQQSYTEVGITGTYTRFVNRVAAVVAAEFPNARLITFAYGITFPPSTVKAHPNVRVCWAPISADYACAFDEGEPNRERDFLGQLDQWLQNTSQLGAWYYQWQADKLMPRLMLYPTKRNLQLLRDRGVDQVFIEMNLATFKDNRISDGDKFLPVWADADKYGWFVIPYGLEHLRAYIYARLLWDPEFDVRNGIREFCTIYYGAAAAEMIRYVDTLESADSYARTISSAFNAYEGVHMSLGLAPQLKWDVTTELDKLFDAAMEKTSGREPFQRRLEMARMSVDLSALVYAKPDDPLRARAFERFFALAEAIGLKDISRTVVTMSKLPLAEFKEKMSHPEQLVIPGEEPVGANVLKNGDFETDIDADGIPDGWSAAGKYLPENYECNPAGVRMDSARARSGKFSVRLEKQPAAMQTVALRQRFDVTPGQTWRAAVRYQAEVDKGGVHMIFTAFGEGGKWLHHQGGVQGRNQTGDNWSELTADTDVDENTSQLMVEVLLYDDQAAGTVWIDEFTCGRVQK